MNILKNFFRRNTIELHASTMENYLEGLIDSKRYADAYLFMVFNQIFAGLRNIRFKVREDKLTTPAERVALEGIFEYIYTNIATIFYTIWFNGFIAFRTNGNSIEIVPQNEIIFDDNGLIANYDIVYYSDEYLTLNKKSALIVLSETINDLDVINNANNYLVSHLGTLGVISGQSLPLTKADREEFLRDIKSEMGITSNRFQFKISSKPITFQQIDFKIRELNLPSKIKDDLKLIAGYFRVPYDLIPFSGQSTYANQEQAQIQFYRNCISPMAEIILSLIGSYLKRSSFNLKGDVVTFVIDNVPELQTDELTILERLDKVATVAEKFKRLGWDISKLEQIAKNYE